MKIILGSASPRRKKILGQLIDNLITISPDIDESRRRNESPPDFSLRISREKAESLIEAAVPSGIPSLLITSDTIVAIEDNILGKPASYDEAAAMLQTLSGKTHRVITGITIVYSAPEKKNIFSESDYEVTDVKFKSLNPEDIKNYLSMIDYTDKAGAYAIQHHGDQIIDSIKGSLTNVIGFPLRLFFSMIVRNNLEKIFFV